MQRHHTRMSVLALAGLGLVACGGSSSAEKVNTPPATTAVAAPAAVVTAAKVSANEASKEALVAVMTGAGIANADKWADEIIEYRPYSTADTSLEVLSGELTKYNASPETITQILGLLEVGSEAPAAAVTAAKVSANEASKEALVAAMTGAGIANADKWADEIIEYRPYSTADTSLEVLSGELTKYNASPETITQIIGLLEL